MDDSSDFEFIDRDGVIPRLRTYLEIGANILLVGKPGTGKTELLRWLVGADNLVTVMASDLTKAELLGGWKPTPDGHFAFVDGALTHAVRVNKPFYCDEIANLDKEVWVALHGLLDARRELLVDSDKQETIQPGPGFCFIASTNPVEGTDPLPPEVRDRFVLVRIPELEEASETKFLVDRHNISSKDASYLVRYARIVRTALDGGASLRTLELASRSVLAGLDRADAAMDCLLVPAAGASDLRRDAAINALLSEGMIAEEHTPWPPTPEAEVLVTIEEDQELWG